MKPGGARRSESEIVSEGKKLERSDFCPREEMTPRRAETNALVPSPEPARDGRRDRARRAADVALARSRRPSRVSRVLDGDVTAVDRARDDATRARASVQINSIRRGPIEIVARRSPL